MHICVTDLRLLYMNARIHARCKFAMKHLFLFFLSPSPFFLIITNLHTVFIFFTFCMCMHADDDWVMWVVFSSFFFSYSFILFLHSFPFVFIFLLYACIYKIFSFLLLFYFFSFFICILIFSLYFLNLFLLPFINLWLYIIKYIFN